MIKVEGLKIDFFDASGERKPGVSDISFTIPEKQIIGLIGESGSGKTITALAILGLLKERAPQARISGKILWNSLGSTLDLSKFSHSDYQKIRGRDICIILQNPFTFFNPSLRIRRQFKEVLDSLSPSRVSEILKEVQLHDEERILESYAHELSGGQLQRLMIAIALLHHPKFLIADEPTTALDPTLKWEILNLLQKLKEQHGLTLLIISHDVASVGQICDSLMVMVGGVIVEEGPAEIILKSPMHPYTQALMGHEEGSLEERQSQTIQNQGCPYVFQCPSTKSICSEKMPPFFSSGTHHRTRCWLYGEPHG